MRRPQRPTTEREITAKFYGLPFEYDLLSRDLDSHYDGFVQGEQLHWGIIVRAVAGSWNEDTTIKGIDWVARFAPPKAIKVPRARGDRTRRSWRTIKDHCLLVAVQTGQTTMNDARDAGRPAVRAIASLIRREVPVIIPADVLWEGALAAAKGREKWSTAESETKPTKPIGKARLHRMGLSLAKISAKEMPPHLRQALEWLNLARAARARSEMFMHLWLSILTLASYGQPQRRADKARMSEYTAKLLQGVPGVVTSPLVVHELSQRLGVAYDIRNDLVHRSDDSRIDNALLQSLENDAFLFVDFELAKLGTPISA